MMQRTNLTLTQMHALRYLLQNCRSWNDEYSASNESHAAQEQRLRLCIAQLVPSPEQLEVVLKEPTWDEKEVMLGWLRKEASSDGSTTYERPLPEYDSRVEGATDPPMTEEERARILSVMAEIRRAIGM